MKQSVPLLSTKRSLPLSYDADESVSAVVFRYPIVYCTLAVTLALPLSVNVHVRALFPPLEQAPDQMASRPLDTLNVIEVPIGNAVEPVLPTLTLTPDGLDSTLSPLRPVAVTVSVAV
jgi:hypothetical protein